MRLHVRITSRFLFLIFSALKLYGIKYCRAVFNEVLKVTSRLVWSYFSWLPTFVPFSQPKKKKKNPRLGHTRFPAQDCCHMYLLRILIVHWLFTSVVNGQSNYVGFGFTTLKLVKTF